MRFGLDPPVYLNGKPSNCHWCGNSLHNIRNIYKGKNCDRYYCGLDHLESGEERAAIYARAGGYMHSPWYVVIAAVVAVAMLAFAWTPKAHAHDPDTHQSDDLAKATSEAFGSCCVGDDYNKLRVGDWESTSSGYRVFYKGRWLEGSRRVKVNNMENPDGEAKAWIFGEGDTAYIRCFMAGARS